MRQKVYLTVSDTDTGARFSTLRVPQWDRVIELAASCSALTGLGYIGADVVIDNKLGPMLLELNARPGLAIQVANQAGLIHRMDIARDIIATTDDPVQRIQLAKKRFSSAATT